MEIKKIGRFLFYGFGFLGAVAAIITIWTFAFEVQEPNLVYEITSSVDAIDVNNPVEGLNVHIGDVDILNSEKSIRIVELQIRNSGGGDILKTFYDENAPIGLKLQQGKFLSGPALISASNGYLKSSAEFNRKNSKKLSLRPVIIDAGQWVRYRLTILYNSSDDFKLKPIGKIAGQQDIKLVHNIQSEQQSFMDRAFQGPILVQIVRAIGYTLVILCLSVIIGILISELFSSVEKFNRSKVVEYFKNQFPEMSDSILPILNNYQNNGPFDILYTRFLLDPGMLNLLMKDFSKTDRPLSHTSDAEDISHSSYYIPSNFELPHSKELKELFDKNIIYKENDQYYVSQDSIQSLKMFVEFLKTHRYKDFKDLNIHNSF